MDEFAKQEHVSTSHARASASPVKPESSAVASAGPFAARWLAVEITIVVALIAGAYLMHMSPTNSSAPEAVETTPATEGAPAPTVIPEPVAESAVDTPELDQPTPTESPVAQTPSLEPVAPTITIVSQTEVEALLQTWTAAWEQQNLDGYFAAYAIDFAPANQSRATWQAARQRSITNASNISISWRDLKVEAQGNEEALAEVWLDYTAAAYSDSTLKQLQLRREGGALHISAERNLRVEKH